MYNNNNKVLVVIPARGGSKGIPRKNLRLLGEKPLIAYSILMAKSSEYVDDVVVSTEDAQIRLLSEKFGASTIIRPPELAKDDVPLDPVIYDAMLQREKVIFDEYDIIITVQPTSPLLKTITLNKAIEKFDDFDVDSVISVVDDRHLSWGFDSKNNKYFPLYHKRVNRQYLPKSFKETGSFLATRRRCMSETSRLGDNIDLVEISSEESVDIDSYEDWWVAENYINKKKIAIVVNAYNEIGTGHIYRCISIASKLVFHDVLFILNQGHDLGIEIIKDNYYPYVTYDDGDEFLNILEKFSPHIIINDILDTSLDYINTLKQKGFFVINFEDLGLGTEAADLVFDALYEHNLDENNIFVGHKYYILKDEFYFQNPKVITEEVNNVLITFGGTDPNNFTEKVLDSIIQSGFSKQINVILGIGYKDKSGIIEKYNIYNNVVIYENVDNISEHMLMADVIFTSAGRTMYEVCSLGVPCICLCQNDRERTHVFGNYKNGFINMGLGAEISQEKIIEQFNTIVNDFELRKTMNKRMLSVDLKHRFENIWAIVKSRYRDFKLSN